MLRRERLGTASPIDSRSNRGILKYTAGPAQTTALVPPSSMIAAAARCVAQRVPLQTDLRGVATVSPQYAPCNAVFGDDYRGAWTACGLRAEMAYSGVCISSGWHT